jgi:Beta-lactamase
VMKAAKKHLLDSIEAAVQHPTSSVELDPHNTSFSIDIYSAFDNDSLFTYHYSAPALAKSSDGVRTVDSDTIYRIGSISKLLTVYTYLLAAGDLSFNNPITEYVPELAAYAAKNKNLLKDNTLEVTDWESITIGALASHMAGIPRDFPGGPAADSLLTDLGLPPVPAVNISYCGEPLEFPCNREGKSLRF